MTNAFSSSVDSEARRLAIAQADAWLALQAERLGISSEAIDELIRPLY